MRDVKGSELRTCVIWKKVKELWRDDKKDVLYASGKIFALFL